MDYRDHEFWGKQEHESYGEWGKRIRSSRRDRDDILRGFLDDPRPEVRRIAIEALRCLEKRPSPLLTQRVLALLAGDPSGTVRERAMAFCHSFKLKEAAPIITQILRDPELLQRLQADLSLAGNPPNELLRRANFTMRGLGYVPPPSDELLAASRPPLPRFPAPLRGAYVGAQFSRTTLLPKERGPGCPCCRRGLTALIRLGPELGPPDAPRNGLPFYRCLRCVMHEPLYVRIEGKVGCLNRPAADQDEDRSPDRDSLPSGVLWYVPSPMDTDPQWRQALGGEPHWLQQPDHPSCPTCSQRMRFVVQLGYDYWYFPVTEFGGTDYLFWCGACRVTATLFQTT